MFLRQSNFFFHIPLTPQLALMNEARRYHSLLSRIDVLLFYTFSSKLLIWLAFVRTTSFKVHESQHSIQSQHLKYFNSVYSRCIQNTRPHDKTNEKQTLTSLHLSLKFLLVRKFDGSSIQQATPAPFFVNHPAMQTFYCSITPPVITTTRKSRILSLFPVSVFCFTYFCVLFSSIYGQLQIFQECSEYSKIQLS